MGRASRFVLPGVLTRLQSAAGVACACTSHRRAGARPGRRPPSRLAGAGGRVLLRARSRRVRPRRRARARPESAQHEYGGVSRVPLLAARGDRPRVRDDRTGDGDEPRLPRLVSLRLFRPPLHARGVRGSAGRGAQDQHAAEPVVAMGGGGLGRAARTRGRRHSGPRRLSGTGPRTGKRRRASRRDRALAVEPASERQPRDGGLPEGVGAEERDDGIRATAAIERRQARCGHVDRRHSVHVRRDRRRVALARRRAHRGHHRRPGRFAYLSVVAEHTARQYKSTSGECDRSARRWVHATSSTAASAEAAARCGSPRASSMPTVARSSGARPTHARFSRAISSPFKTT